MPFTPYKQQNTSSFTPISDTMIKKYQEQEQPKQDGLLKSIIKDVAGTLLVKPAARTTEAITRTLAPESQAAKGYELMAQEDQAQNIGGIEVPQLTKENATREITGEALKTASYLFPYGKVAGLATGTLGKVGGSIASGATGGYLADVGYGLTDKEQTVGQALTPGLGTALGVAIPATGATLRGVGKLTKKTGEKIAESVIPTSSREATILQTYKANNPFLKRVGDVLKGTEKAPQTVGRTAVEKGLIGTKSGIGVQAKRASDTLWKDIISPRLKTSEQAVDLDGFFTKIQDDIVKANPDPTRQKSLLEALNAIKEDFSGTKAVSVEGLQKLKESWARFVPEKAYNGKPIAGAVNEVRNLMSGEARQTIYNILGDDVKQAYIDYGNLIGLRELGKSSMTGAKLKGGAGSFASEILSQTVTPIATIGGQVVYRLGKGLEFIGNLGAKNLSEALGVNLKFPGDKAVEDIGKRIKQIKSTPNKQGGFVSLGQDANLPIKTQSTQTPKTINKNSNISSSIPQTTKNTTKLSTASKLSKTVDEEIAGNIDELLMEANKITKRGKIELNAIAELEDLQKKVVKGKLTRDEKLRFNELAKKFKREDLIPNVEIKSKTK